VNLDKSKRRVPLAPLLVGIAALLVVCAGGTVVAANVQPLAGMLWGTPDTQIVACDVQEHKVPFPTEAGFAEVTLRVTNLSSQDLIYRVVVVVKDLGGEAAGMVEHRIGVPARHLREQTWRVTLTKPGGRKCEVVKAEKSAT
jgi:hypothetical protein